VEVENICFIKVIQSKTFAMQKEVYVKEEAMNKSSGRHKPDRCRIAEMMSKTKVSSQ